LFTTGYTRKAIIHQGRFDEEVNLIGKPITATALARQVRQLLGADCHGKRREALRGAHALVGTGKLAGTAKRRKVAKPGLRAGRQPASSGSVRASEPVSCR
jgi:hypothetical protein